MENFKKSEYQGAEDFEGKRIPFSGSRAEDKLDIIAGERFGAKKIENKYTDKGSYSVKLAYLKECERLARIEGKKFMLRIDFSLKDQYILVKQSDYKELYENNE